MGTQFIFINTDVIIFPETYHYPGFELWDQYRFVSIVFVHAKSVVDWGIILLNLRAYILFDK